jgi:hypothetical protein
MQTVSGKRDFPRRRLSGRLSARRTGCFRHGFPRHGPKNLLSHGFQRNRFPSNHDHHDQPATGSRGAASRSGEATGKSISTLVVEAVEARLALTQLRFKDILAPVHAEFRRSGMSAAELNTLLEESLEKARSERRSHPGSAA